MLNVIQVREADWAHINELQEGKSRKESPGYADLITIFLAWDSPHPQPGTLMCFHIQSRDNTRANFLVDSMQPKIANTLMAQW